MNSKKFFIFCILIALSLTNESIRTIQSFNQLAQLHCNSFPIEILFRLSTGQLAQIYGAKYKDLDCYIRQFVNKDGQDKFEEEEESQQQDGESAQKQVQIIPQIDPLVEEYAKGLISCLPEGVDPIEATYAIWRFTRFIIQNDYALEWLRAKIRATLGYEAEKPNAWMDGEQSENRVRLDKLFSNQFYDYVDKLMFRDFLHPFLTFLKKNLVFAATGHITQSGKPILIQYIESKNVHEKVFIPVIFKHKQIGNIFTYTIPGIPLLLGGSHKKLSWAFTGVLVDRSNIEQIQTLGNKFFHHDSETWIKLQNVTHSIKIKSQEPFQCKYTHSSYGTLYEKHHSQSGKVSEYIARWHEKQNKVRVVFSQLFQFIVKNGNSKKQMEFPFSSLVFTNETGVHQYICFQKHPSYFLYPDLAGAPESSNTKWTSNPKRNFLIVSNTHLTTKNQESYVKREVQNPTEQQFLMDTRRKISTLDKKFTIDSLFQFVIGVQTDPLVKKRKDQLIHIYRKAKFLFFPQENLRKECDQLIASLQKWDHHYNTNSQSTVIFILWDYFFKQYTFNHVASTDTGLNLAKHKIITDVYWTNQVENWKVGTSYGECDSNEWEIDYKKKLNGTGENSTCFFNIMRGINRTRQILRNQVGGIKDVKLSDFIEVKLLNFEGQYLGSHIDEAFNRFFSKNVAFSAEIDNDKVLYYEGYNQVKKYADLSFHQKKEEIETAQGLDNDL